jgi:hypothetical protein
MQPSAASRPSVRIVVSPSTFGLDEVQEVLVREGADGWARGAGVPARAPGRAAPGRAGAVEEDGPSRVVLVVEVELAECDDERLGAFHGSLSAPKRSRLPGFSGRVQSVRITPFSTSAPKC